MTTFQTLMISSVLLLSAGCAATQPTQPPFCLPDRTPLEPLSIEDQRTLQAANSEALALLALNDIRLKADLSTFESLARTYNRELNLGSCEEQ